MTNSDSQLPDIDKAYDCFFCDDTEKNWNLKTEEYEPCGCIERKQAIKSEIIRMLEGLKVGAQNAYINYEQQDVILVEKLDDLIGKLK